MQIRKILVGVDFSERSDIAVEQAINIARKTEAEVVLLHAGTVPDQISGLSPRMEGAAKHFEQLLAEQLAENRERLEELRERCNSGGVRVSHMMLDAFPDTGLANASRELDADLTVVGTHGRTGFDRFLMGSVAERTVRLTEGNVMVARGRGRGAGGYKKILVPVDFSPLSDELMQVATTLAAKAAVVEVFNMWELPGTNWMTKDVKTATGGELRVHLAEAAEQAGKELIERYWREDDVKITFSQDEGAPAHGINEYLEADGHDLVVMGSHGRRGLRRFMLGSVAEATVRYAPCSVVVIHGAEKGGQ
jgi:nucleotide-binding universal stress UspA family protein